MKLNHSIIYILLLFCCFFWNLNLISVISKCQFSSFSPIKLENYKRILGMKYALNTLRFQQKSEITSHKLNNDETKEIINLEVKSRIFDIFFHDKIYSKYKYILSSLLINSDSSKVSTSKWSTLNKHLKSNLDLNNTVINELYETTQELLPTVTELSKEYCLSKIQSEYGHIWCDQYQTQTNEKRSLGLLRENGIVICLHKKFLKELKNEETKFRQPIIEKFKNLHCININGLKNSKLSLAVHDIFDHFWITHLLDTHGILCRYYRFFDKVGNPHKTDMYAREGELIASIGFNFRGWNSQQRDVPLIISLNQIKELISKDSIILENKKRALDILNKTSNKKALGKYIEYTINDILIELMEQRRKFGFIKLIDNKNHFYGILGALDIEYLSFIVEACNLLQKKKESLFKVENRLSLLVENYLHTIIYDMSNEKLLTKIPNLIIRLEDLEVDDNNKNILIPNEKIYWIEQNPGSTSTRKLIY